MHARAESAFSAVPSVADPYLVPALLDDSGDHLDDIDGVDSLQLYQTSLDVSFYDVHSGNAVHEVDDESVDRHGAVRNGASSGSYVDARFEPDTTRHGLLSSPSPSHSMTSQRGRAQAVSRLRHRDDTAAPDFYERLRIVAVRLRNTSSCLGLYVTLIILNLFVLLWELLGGSSHWAVLAIEAVINVLLVLEVAVNLLTLGWSYWEAWGNRADFIITVFCVLFFILYVEEEYPLDESKELSYVDTILIATRYIVQLGRLAFIAYRGRQTTKFLQQEDVQFPADDFNMDIPAMNGSRTSLPLIRFGDDDDDDDDDDGDDGDIDDVNFDANVGHADSTRIDYGVTED
jgi:hypothetical protein